MGKRIFSTVVLWLFLFAVLWEFRTIGAIVVCAAIAALTLRELFILLDATGAQTFSSLGIAFGTLVSIEPWLAVRYGLPGHGLLALGTVIFAVRILGEREPDKRLESLKSTVFGVLYVGFMLQYMVRIVTPLPTDGALSPDGRLVLALWVIATAKFCDVGALLTGLAFGKHKMAPTISPKKTWEGFVGGMFTSVGIGALVAWFARDLFPASLGMDPLHAGLKAIPVAAAGIAADLVESVIKRKAAIKDSGVAIPGIGGIFDLSDSLLLASPIAFFVIGLR